MDLMGIWGYEGYVGMRITCRGMRDCGDMRDMRDMRDGPPPRNRPGRAAVFWSTPPVNKGWGIGMANDQRTEKRMLIFNLNC